MKGLPHSLSLKEGSRRDTDKVAAVLRIEGNELKKVKLGLSAAGKHFLSCPHWIGFQGHSLEVFVVGEKFIELCVLSGFWLSINQGSIILSTFSLLKLPGVFLPHFPRKGNELGKVGNRARRKSLVWKCFGLGTADS